MASPESKQELLATGIRVARSKAHAWPLIAGATVASVALLGASASSARSTGARIDLGLTLAMAIGFGVVVVGLGGATGRVLSTMADALAPPPHALELQQACGELASEDLRGAWRVQLTVAASGQTTVERVEAPYGAPEEGRAAVEACLAREVSAWTPDLADPDRSPHPGRGDGDPPWRHVVVVDLPETSTAIPGL